MIHRIPQIMASTTRTVFKPKAATGFGLMGMTWCDPQYHTPDAQAFEAMKTAIAHGATFWSSADYYGKPEPSLGLQLIRRYFKAYPEDASKVTLFIKGCVDFKTMNPKVSREEVLASAEAVIKHLDGAKKIDIFGPARRNPEVPLEETLGALKELVDAGKIGAVGLSEVGAESIEKANSIYPLSLVEVEFSLFTTDLLHNGVADTARRLGIPIVAYSPQGRGFLTDSIKSLDDIPEGDIRRRFERFSPENFPKNLELVEKVKAVASKKGVKPGQLALAWIRANGRPKKLTPEQKAAGVVLSEDDQKELTFIPIPGSTKPKNVTENSTVVEITEEEKAELDDILKTIPVHGGRYNKHLEWMCWQ
ncbi:NADP-dependent oxidoreductase domain-containing protein [Camillea tinctor]|nr:NADP-dependent oxidoreductase domain-containing protein [Camillea tinctor]